MDTTSTLPHLSGKQRHVFPDDYANADGIYLPNVACKSLGYSDGDAQEEYLLQTIKAASDRSVLSRELAGAIRDWVSVYHLSPKRTNLLRPFEPLLRARVVEVGAGCGALTRYLGEIGAEVVAVEGSRRRAQIARERTAELDNVTVVVDRIEDFAAREAFDVTVVVGVLEYSRIFLADAAEPEKQFLAQLGRLLKPDGVIILAIENKLGLKYFAGAREDHLGTPFAGIDGNYAGRSPVTFGQKELRQLLETAGFAAQRWFVPCPDYKLPTTVLSPALLSEHTELAATLLAQSTILDPQRPGEPAFSLEQAWGELERNGLVEHFANSFLVVAGRTPEALRVVDRDRALAWHYTTDRHPAFAKQAQFVAQGGGIIVQRSHLSPTPPPAVPLECVIESERFVGGENWWRTLCAIINTPNWTVRQVADWARPWIDALLRECKLEALSGESFRSYVSGRFFDATPFNLIRGADGAFSFIDQEWRLRPDVELGFLIFRGLRDSLVRVTSSAAPAPPTPANINLIISAALGELGVMVTKIELDRFALLERQAQDWVQGRSVEAVSDDWIANIWNAVMYRRAPLERSALVAARDAAIAERDDTAARLAGELAAAREDASHHAADRERLRVELDVLKPALDELLQVKARLAASEEALAQSRNYIAAARDEAGRSGSERERLGTELQKATVTLNERQAVMARLSAELDAAGAAAAHAEKERDTARLYLRESQAEVQRLSGELDAARGETERITAERERLASELVLVTGELATARTRVKKLKAEADTLVRSGAALQVARDGHRAALAALDAAQATAARHQVRAAEFATRLADFAADKDQLAAELEQARDDASRRDRIIAESATRLAEVAADKHRVATELERARDDARRSERVAAQRIAAVEAARATALAESDNRAHARIRALQDKLVDAEAAVAKYKNGRANGASWTGRLSLARRRALRQIAKSGLFDVDWYVREYPDVAASGRPPAEHYLDEGYLHGYRPNPMFDTRWYLDHYEDVRHASVNPLLHYIHDGYREGRDPGPDFHTDFYLMTNPDVRASGMNPLFHYLRHGKKEGRQPVRPRDGH